jgi:hypothetical protein
MDKALFLKDNIYFAFRVFSASLHPVKQLATRGRFFDLKEGKGGRRTDFELEKLNLTLLGPAFKLISIYPLCFNAQGNENTSGNNSLFRLGWQSG